MSVTASLGRWTTAELLRHGDRLQHHWQVKAAELQDPQVWHMAVLANQTIDQELLKRGIER